MAAQAADGKRALLLATLLGATLVVSPAAAAPDDAELQAARQLFVQAEGDEDAGRWTDALEKLRRVAAVKQTAGVRYHVALCEEHLGQLAAALDDFTTAERQARDEKADDVLRLVGKQLAELGPRVPRLTIDVVPALPDVVVKVDGAPLARSRLGAAIPLDTGTHRVDVAAPDRPPSTQTLTLHERDIRVLEMRLADPAPLAPPPSAPPPSVSTPAAPAQPLPSSSVHVPSRTGAIVATGAAIVLAGVGVVAFVLAGSAHSDGEAQCLTENSAATDACDPQKNAVRAWDFAAAAAWLGAAGATTLAIVLWTRPSHDASPPASAHVVLGPGSFGVGGHF